MKVGRRIGTVKRPAHEVRMNTSSPQSHGLILWDPMSGSSVMRSSSTFVNYATNTKIKTMSNTSPGNATGRDNTHVGYAPTLGAVLDHGFTDITQGYTGPNSLNFETDVNTAGGGWTISWWGFGKQDYGNLLKLNGTNGKFVARIDYSSVVKLLYNTGSWNNISHTMTGLDADNNILYHGTIVWRQDGTGPIGHGEIWINGHEVATSSGTSSINNSDAVTINSYLMSATDEAVHGKYADVRVYNRPLTSDEIWQLYDPRTRWELYEQAPRKIARKAEPSVRQSTSLQDNDISGIFTVAYPSNLKSGTTLFCFVSSYAPGGTAITVSDGDNGSYTEIDNANANYNPANNDWGAMYYFENNTSTGTPTVTITHTGVTAITYTTIVIGEIDGVATSSVLEDSAGDSPANSASASSGNATSAGDALFLGAVFQDNGDVTFTETMTGATVIFEEELGSSNMPISVIYAKAGPSGLTDDATWTLGSSQKWRAVLGVFSAPADAAPSTALTEASRTRASVRSIWKPWNRALVYPNSTVDVQDRAMIANSYYIAPVVGGDTIKDVVGRGVIPFRRS